MNITTVCPYCGVGCLLRLHVRDGRVVGVLPHEAGPGEGKLCIKGWSAHEFIHHPERLTKPLIRDGECFREATWDEALDTIATKITEYKSKFGADSVAFLLGEPKEMEFAFAQRFASAFGTANCVTPGNY